MQTMCSHDLHEWALMLPACKSKRAGVNMPKSTAPTRYGTGTLIAAASICLFLVTWAYFFVQVRQERAAREAQAHTSPVTAPGTPDLVILQQADPANDLSVPVA